MPLIEAQVKPGKKLGLVTPGVSRIHTGRSAESRPSRQSSTQQAWPTPRKEGETCEPQAAPTGYVEIDNSSVEKTEYKKYD